MQSMSDTLVEDVPVYQHTMWIISLHHRGRLDTFLS